MALQVWLPLNKDLRNQGLTNIGNPNQVTAVFNANGGKFGGCYTFLDADIQKIKYSSSAAVKPLIDSHSFTVSVWAKVTKSSCFLSVTYGFIFWTHNAYIPNANVGISGANDNKWHHLCYTYNADTFTATSYKDGVKQNTKIGTSIATTTYSNGWQIGHDVNANTSGNTLNGSINDLRIYDNCLSEEEVRELALGKCFEIDKWSTLEGITNLMGSKGESFEGWSSSGMGNKGIKTIHTDMQPAICGQVCEVMASTAATANTAVEMATSFTNCPHIKSGESLTFSVYLKGDDSTNGKSGYLHAYNRTGDIIKSLRVCTFKFTKEWQRISGQYTWPASGETNGNYNTYIVGTIQSGDKYYFSNAQLEVGKQAHPYVKGSHEALCGDSSGLGHIETEHNIITSGSSMYFNGSSYAEYDGMPLSGGSVSLWVYKATAPSSNEIIFVDGVSKMGLGFNGSSKFIANAGGTYGPTFSTASFKWGEWNHIALTYGTNKAVNNCYLNGVSLSTGTTNYWIENTSKLIVGKRSTGDGFNGYLRKFTIYTEQLTESDIKRIYDKGPQI